MDDHSSTRINLMSRQIWDDLRAALKDGRLKDDDELLNVVVSLMINSVLGPMTKPEADALMAELYQHAQHMLDDQWLHAQEYLRQSEGKPS